MEKNLKLFPASSPRAEDILRNFYDQYGPEDGRRQLWQWLQVAATGSYHSLTLAEKENLFNFYVHVDELITAAHTLMKDPAGKGDQAP